MNKKTSLLAGIFLLVIAVCFIGYAFNHPEAIFPWSNGVTFMLYIIYVWLLFKFLLMEISGETVDFYTVVRGLIVIGGVDIGIENLCLYVKQRKKVTQQFKIQLV